MQLNPTNSLKSTPKTHKLAICVPTFNRPKNLAVLVTRLLDSISLVDRNLHRTVLLFIIDNHSETLTLFNDIPIHLLQLTIEIRVIRNSRNIGGDENLALAAQLGQAADFTWIVGDDDLPAIWSVGYVLQQIESIPNLGLAILLGPPDGWDALLPLPHIFDNYKQVINFFSNFSVFPTESRGINPILGHTLISCNVYRSDCYSSQIFEFVQDILNPSIGLPINFCHMYSTIHTLLKRDDYRILFSHPYAIEAVKLNPSNDQEQLVHIKTIYHTYINYIRHYAGGYGFTFS